MNDLSLLNSDVVVRAGAGTGKTYALVGVVLHALGGVSALREPLQPEEITALTFTEAAAAEMRQRIHDRVVALANAEAPEDTRLLDDAAQHLGVQAPDQGLWVALRPRLRRLRVTTFHGWALGILRAHAAAAGIDPLIEPLDEEEASLLWRQVIEAELLADLDHAESPTHLLLTQQAFGRRDSRAGDLISRLAILLQILREEGSGPERLAERGQADPDRAERHAEAAARELREAVRNLGAREREATAAKRAQVLDLQSLAGLESAWRAEALEATGEQVAALVKGNWGGARTPLGALVHEIRKSIESLYEAFAEVQAVPQVRALQSLLGRILASGERRKQAQGRLDFTDMLLLTRDLLHRNASVCRSEEAACRLLLVDEFQDTNPIQAELVAAVTPAGRPERRRFLVGDPKQSIYAFRGADVAVYERAVRRAVDQGAREHALRSSWRSRPALLPLINRLAAALFHRERGPDFAVHYVPERDDLVAVREGTALAPAEWIRIAAEDLNAPLRRAREFQALARHLRALVAGETDLRVRAAGSPGEPELSRPPRCGDIAILLRAATHVGGLLRALDWQGIPAVLFKGRGFDRAPEIRDLVHCLRVAADPDDALALAVVLRSPLVGVTDDGLLQLSRSEGLVARALIHNKAALPAGIPALDVRLLQRFSLGLRWLAPRLARLGPAQALELILEWTDFEAFCVASARGAQALANVRMLVDLARLEEERGGDCASFIRRFSERLDRPSRTPPAEVERPWSDQVQVMTIHAAKGLEFPIVVVADLGHAQRPQADNWLLDRDAGFGLRVRAHRDASWRRSGDWRRAREALADREAEESKRLFYVALTRARDHLVFSGQGPPHSWGGWLAERSDALQCEGLLRVRVAREGISGRLPALAQAADDGPEITVEEKPAFAASTRVEAPIEITTTGLDYLLQCPRLYRLKGVLGWDEGLVRGRDRGASGEEARREGELVHALLERVDLVKVARDPHQALAAASADLAPRDALLERAQSTVLRFLQSAAGERVLAAEALERELDFRLQLPALPNAPALLIRGRIDLMLFESGGAILVVDYKNTLYRAESHQRYANQLGLYALAVEALERARGQDQCSLVEAALCYLGEEPPVIRSVKPDPDLEIKIRTAVQTLAAGQHARAWPGRPQDFCQLHHCAFLPWCHSS